MQKVHSWFIPEYDTHYKEYLTSNAETEYQKKPRDHALEQVKRFRTAIDVGGNIGFWSRDLCRKFDNVVIFEPDQSNVDCLNMNLQEHNNYTLHKVGLGNITGNRTFYKSKVSSGGHTFIKEHANDNDVEQISLQIEPLDSYNFTDVDFIKIDTQGSELSVLQGAKETLMNNYCVINVEIEQKNSVQVKNSKPIFKFMQSIGYHTLKRYKRDEVLFAKR